MTDKNQTPLDYDEDLAEAEELAVTPTQRLLQNLEFLPLIVLALGLFMKNKGWEYGRELLIIGGLASAILYVFFSWYMFRVGKYRPLEIVLSVLCGLVFPIGILGIIFGLESWESGDTLLNIGMYGGLSLSFISIVLFALHLKDKRATLFYRKLIARLLVFTMLLLYFNRIYF